jgi:polysaccharide biosynthesis/export protein
MHNVRRCRLFIALALGVFAGLGSVGCQAEITVLPDESRGATSAAQIGNKPSAGMTGPDIRTVSATGVAEGAEPAAPDLPPGAVLPPAGDCPPVLPLPRELAPTVHPAYVIEPPDVLNIEAVRLIPKPPYKIEPLDVLLLQATETLPNQPISGPFAVAPEGVVNLGNNYGVVRVVGMTVEQAALAMRAQLRNQGLQNAQVSVSLVQSPGNQLIRGDHLVYQDGTISLGVYGNVNVTGLTLPQAKIAIEHHLGQYLLNPEIALSVSAFNSKVYYVITDGGGFGQQVYRFPITGKEYVLDAVSNIGGLPAVSSKRRIWVARPAPAEKGCYQILPVDWEVVTEAGATCTNYQLLPGDRVYVMADPYITFDNAIEKILLPIERLFHNTLLGETTVQSIRFNSVNNFGFVPVAR